MQKGNIIKLVFLAAILSLTLSSCYTQFAVVKRERVYTVDEEEYYSEEDTVYYEDEEGDTYVTEYRVYDFPAVYSYRFTMYDPCYWDDFYPYSCYPYSCYPYWMGCYGGWYAPFVNYDPYYYYEYGGYWNSGYYPEHHKLRYSKRGPLNRDIGPTRFARTSRTRSSGTLDKPVARRKPGSLIAARDSKKSEGSRQSKRITDDNRIPVRAVSGGGERAATISAKGKRTSGKEIKTRNVKTSQRKKYYPIKPSSTKKKNQKVKMVKTSRTKKSGSSNSGGKKKVSSSSKNKKSSSYSPRKSSNTNRSSSSGSRVSSPSRSSSSSSRVSSSRSSSGSRSSSSKSSSSSRSGGSRRR